MIYRLGSESMTAASAGSLVTHFQVVAAFVQFSIAWPCEFREWTEWLLAVFSFKLDFLARPECSMRLSPLTAFIFKLTMPAYFILAFIAYFWFSKWLRPKLTFWKSSFVENHAIMLVAIRAQCLRASVQILSFCYIYVVQKAAAAGDCSIPNPGEDPVLDSNESIRCAIDDPVWPYMAAIGFFTFIMYGCVAPVYLLRRLKRARAQGSRAHQNPAFQAMFGWMLRKYSGDRYYWECVITARKMAVSVIFLLTTKYPSIQIFASMAVVLVSLFYTFKRRPFRCRTCDQKLDDTLYKTEDEEASAYKKRRDFVAKLRGAASSTPGGGLGDADEAALLREAAETAAAAPLIARKTAVFMGSKVTEKSIGKNFFRLLLAHANFSLVCPHMSWIDLLECILLFVELVLLVIAGILHFAKPPEGSTLSKVVNNILIFVVIPLSIGLAVSTDCLLARYDYLKSKARKKRLAEHGYDNDTIEALRGHGRTRRRTQMLRKVSFGHLIHRSHGKTKKSNLHLMLGNITDEQMDAALRKRKMTLVARAAAATTAAFAESHERHNLAMGRARHTVRKGEGGLAHRAADAFAAGAGAGAGGLGGKEAEAEAGATLGGPQFAAVLKKLDAEANKMCEEQRERTSKTLKRRKTRLAQRRGSFGSGGFRQTAGKVRPRRLSCPELEVLHMALGPTQAKEQDPIFKKKKKKGLSRTPSNRDLVAAMRRKQRRRSMPQLDSFHVNVSGSAKGPPSVAPSVGGGGLKMKKTMGLIHDDGGDGAGKKKHHQKKDKKKRRKSHHHTGKTKKKKRRRSTTHKNKHRQKMHRNAAMVPALDAVAEEGGEAGGSGGGAEAAKEKERRRKATHKGRRGSVARLHAMLMQHDARERKKGGGEGGGEGGEGYTPRASTLKQAYAVLDEDGNGNVDITEFAHACKTSVDDERMQTLFALLDEDGGGTLELAEVASVLRNNAEARALAGNFSKLEDLVRLANERRKRKRRRTAAKLKAAGALGRSKSRARRLSERKMRNKKKRAEMQQLSTLAEDADPPTSRAAAPMLIGARMVVWGQRARRSSRARREKEEATRAGDEFARHVQFGGGADEAGHATAAANDFAAEATRKG